MVLNEHLDEGVITLVTSDLCHHVIIGIVISVGTVIVALKLVMLWTWLRPLVVTRIHRVVCRIENGRRKDVDVVDVSVLIVPSDRWEEVHRGEQVLVE